MKLPWKYIVVSLAIGFLAGSAAGLWGAREIKLQWKQRGPEMILRRMDKDLKLNADQRPRILAILTAEHAKALEAREEIRSATQAQIRPILTPEQATRFDATVAHFDARLKKRQGRQ